MLVSDKYERSEVVVMSCQFEETTGLLLKSHQNDIFHLNYIKWTLICKYTSWFLHGNFISFGTTMGEKMNRNLIFTECWFGFKLSMDLDNEWVSVPGSLYHCHSDLCRTCFPGSTLKWVTRSMWQIWGYCLQMVAKRSALLTIMAYEYPGTLQVCNSLHTRILCLLVVCIWNLKDYKQCMATPISK